MSGTTGDIRQRLRDQVDFVLVNVPGFDAAAGDRPLKALDLRLAELTAAFTMTAFGLPVGEITIAPSHDAALANGGKDYCLIQKFGHLFYGDAAAAVFAALASCSFLTGHIMERGGYFYLHDQCTLINRRAWEALGRPAFGTPVAGTQRAAVPQRAAQNVHDDYTPLFLDPTGTERDWRAAFGYGWNAISASLAHSHRVTNWSDAVRRHKRYCYAYYGDPAEWQRALADVPAAAPTADRGLASVLALLVATGNDTTPALFDDSQLAGLPHLRVRTGLDCVLARPRGFAANIILGSVGFHPETRVVLYDPSAAALAFRRLMIEAWDGKDLAAFLAAARQRLGSDDPAAQALESQRDAAAVRQAFAREIQGVFAGAADWLAHWHRVRALPHVFTQLDPVQEPAAMSALIERHGGPSTALSLGDTFNAFAAIARFDLERRRAAFERIAAALKSKSKLHVMLGEPPLSRIRGG